MLMQEKHQKRLFLAIILSETGHVFCCVLPTIFSIMSLLAGAGLVASMPTWMIGFHDMMHVWEVPMIILSAVVVLLGWGLYFYSRQIDCHNTGCHHEPCGPRKKTANRILVIASILLAFNVTIYLGIHRHFDIEAPHAAAVDNPVHDRGDGHDHDH